MQKKYSIDHILFEITQECNLSCIYCYNYWRRPGEAIQQYSFSTAHKTLKKLFQKIDCKHITFTGGEPFLAEGIEELVLQCRMKGKAVTVITNGTVAKQSSYEILQKFGVSLFELPFHSASSEIHDSLTGHPGSFQKVLESIRILKEVKSEFCVVCVLTKTNTSCLRQTLEAAYDSGVRRFMIARYNIGGRGIHYAQNILPDLQTLRTAFSDANEFSRKSHMKISANVCVPFCIINPQEYPQIPISSCGNTFTRHPITIDASGNMRICNHSPVIIGNIYSDSMQKITESEYVNSWAITRPTYCQPCTQWEICYGGCRAASEQTGRSLCNEDPVISLMNQHPNSIP
jgi:radical SAM protein with 4Fe4S-binding SPASM domain